jgi:hypothetical protein
MTDESAITVSKGGTTFAGQDAVTLFQVAALKSGIGLLMAGIKPNRQWTMTKALAKASQYTGVKYKRSQARQARADLTIWIETMKSAIPVIRD